MQSFLFSLLPLWLCLVSVHGAFFSPLTSVREVWPRSPYARSPGSFSVFVHPEAESDGYEDEEDDEEPGKMRVSELKAELDLRGVDYTDCFDKESLAARLLQARATGKANPAIIDEFNRKRTDESFSGRETDIEDEDIQQMVGGDGTLPGGMPPDMLQKLMANPELMALLQSPKMQEAMKLMMTGGQSALEKAMEEDKEVYEIVTKLNEVMEGSL
mmetsp:Transcript_39082/g.72198  ORF Transcript_39082/g.72198 Transcript_39082/m.72198 type:complete len:215 (-) Transcript_39082:199-843(-)